MSATLELVTFRLAQGTVAGFVAANDTVNQWLKRQPGFLSRHLAEKEDGSFVDLVLWDSAEAARDASKNMIGEIGESEAMTMIDPATVGMVHGSVRLSLGI